MTREPLRKKIREIQAEIARLGPLRPGTVYAGYSVCGKPGCRCGRAKDPVKHGPYHYVSYTFGGKSFTEFVAKKDVAKVRREVATYERLMGLVKALVACHLQRARMEKEES